MILGKPLDFIGPDKFSGHFKVRINMIIVWEFPGGPVVRTRASTAGNTGSIPDRGTKIPHAVTRPK